jgi:glycyl-tRNA synthetase beta chain
VDAFFEGVMVMAEDEAVKNNRLALLGRIGQAFMQVADISGL